MLKPLMDSEKNASVLGLTLKQSVTENMAAAHQVEMQRFHLK